MGKTESTMATTRAKQAWTSTTLVAALRAQRKRRDRVAALKRSGILNQRGDLAKRFKSWGKKKVSHAASPKA
jgi:hypothetical protein